MLLVLNSGFVYDLTIIRLMPNCDEEWITLYIHSLNFIKENGYGFLERKKLNNR